ncbi:hypothetical protein [Puerhibacterium puerhi]|uniref:hypothetical protein n=1 Tax=Puerhibacterium puerhi TaxID=2692623 RepID=UPI00135C9786|nr:hypothetical protein [Puerhibacterium puerhi]
MLLAVGATVVSIPASASVGATVGPVEGAHGTVLADTPAWYSGAVSVLLALQGIAALAGLAGLVLGIVAATRRQVGAGVTAIVIATLAPLVSFGVFLAMVLGSVCCVA